MWCLKVSGDQGGWHREAYFGELLRGHERAIQLRESFAISHSNHAGRTADYYLVTEFAELGSLGSYLGSGAQKRWSTQRVKRESVALLRLLTALHGGGMTHRDLTPGNILVTGQGRLKVGDWGIARTSVGGVLADLDAQNYWFTPPGFKGLPRDDTWMIGQLMAMLLSGTAEGQRTPADVSKKGWDAALTHVISRAIGPASKRYVDAYGMLVDLDGHSRRALPIRSLHRKRVCFTGTLANATRAQARIALEQVGGHYDSEVGPGTDVLVCGHRSPLYIHGRPCTSTEAGARSSQWLSSTVPRSLRNRSSGAFFSPGHVSQPPRVPSCNLR
jgi:serine/threonine protein kinase